MSSPAAQGCIDINGYRYQDLFNLAPKKPNWDLKRDVEKKLERLDRRTQRAIYEIIRQRLEGDKDATLAEKVANAEATQKFEAENQLQDD